MKDKGVTNVAASVRRRLLNLSQARGADYNALLAQYAIEPFLYRLSKSALAVAADSRLTVSLLTPASKQSCVKLPRRAGVQPIRCLITAEQPKLPGVGLDPQFGRRMPPLDRPGLRLLAVLPESVESAAADAKHSSGPRRKSSSLARVKFCIANLLRSVGPR